VDVDAYADTYVDAVARLSAVDMLSARCGPRPAILEGLADAVVQLSAVDAVSTWCGPRRANLQATKVWSGIWIAASTILEAQGPWIRLRLSKEIR